MKDGDVYMTKEKILLKGENTKTLEEISDFLKTLADKIQSGNLTLNQAGKEVNLNLPPKCVLEIEVEEKPKGDRKKHQLEIEIEWFEDGQEQEIKIT